ncbi:NAD-dependent succinate-semialdehyde dehydrogenase [Falsarthrobacter nasiphocae]|uniref:Succinate-semialdehyde dehydrogenase/glutarate-semialdehyde dehydrogenase n=1 Tax=Falsarthrobacter nasiphocae TaxID=189863 RepID=A0AAE3YDS3_9MICC|nr:NAD-dependent succinate-semialdehyde dehydrogenase [Falsarthrobacter nasiphocae]MDR6891524.1 succinate-semialdehyde dehydrogenase/glutarate-semialdehyde dehydrogenase [Falsarthrobacter nasiphocae]
MSDYRTENPATGEVENTWTTLTDEQAQGALDTAHKAFASWRDEPLETRVAVLSKTAQAFKDQAKELAEIAAREMGKPLNQGVEEAELCAQIFAYYADNAEDLLAPTDLGPQGARSSVVELEPVGALVGVMPWNFPYYQVARFVAPNLLLGNTILLKPAEICAASAERIESMLREAGLPQGVYQTIHATNQQIADLVADPRVAGVSLTGSERAGSAVAEGAGRNLTKSLLELGGSDPFIVLGGNIAKTAETAGFARMENAGQACNAPKRMIVLEEHYDEFVEGLVSYVSGLKVGNPLEDGTDMGPLSSVDARDRLVELLEDAREKGATFHTGGTVVDGPGAFIEPAVITGITREMRAFEEELFGPVAVVYKVGSVEEAIELANDTPFGLSGSVWSDDLEKAEATARRIEAGMVYVNEHGTTAAGLPFGGVKRSGYGRELAENGLHEFVNHRLVRVSDAL